MDKELKALLDQARAAGASKEQLQDIVTRYKSKGVQSQTDGDSKSVSADITSSSESKQVSDVFSEVATTPASEIKQAKFAMPNTEFFQNASKNIGKFKTIRDGSGKVSAYDPNKQTPTVDPRTGEVNIQNNPSGEVASRLLKRVKEEAGVPDNVVSTLNKGTDELKYLKEVGDYLHLVSPDFKNKDADQVLEELGIDYKANAESFKRDVDSAAQSMPYYEHEGKGLAKMTIESEDGSLGHNIPEIDFRNLYSELDTYGFNLRDFSNYIESTNPRIKKLLGEQLIRASSDPDNVVQTEIQAFKNLSNYAVDRASYLNKMKGVLEYRQNNGEDVSDSIARVDSELNSLKEGVMNFTKEELPNYVEFLEKNRDKIAKDYKSYKDDNNFDKFAKGVDEFITNVENGAYTGIEDIVVFVADGLGADNFAEEMRLSKEMNRMSEANPLLEMWGVGKTVEHEGTKYMVTDEGQIIDLDTKKNITSITDKIGLDVESIKTKASSVDAPEEIFFSPYNTTIQGGNVLGNLAVQVVGTKGIGSVVGTSSKAMIASNMAMTGGMVYTSTYEDVLQQLRDNNISEKKAREYAGEIAMATGSVAALTSIISPNLEAQKLLSKNGLKNLVKEALEAEIQGGKKAMFNSIKNSTVKSLYGGLKEGSEEVVQENLEYLAERLSSANVNDKIGREVLEEEIKVKDIIDNSILAFGASSALAGLGGLKDKGHSQDKIELYGLLSNNFSATSKAVSNMIDKGVISTEQGGNFIEDLEKFTKYSNKLPETMQVEKTFDMIDLLDKRNKLEERKQKEDKAFHVMINEKIKGVDQEISTLLNQDINAQTETKVEPIDAKVEEQKSQERENTSTLTEEELEFEKTKIKLKGAGIPDYVIDAMPITANITDRFFTDGDTFIDKLKDLFSATGRAYFKDGRIEMNKLFTTFMSSSSYDKVLFHEAVHSATLDALWRTEAYPENYTKEQVRAADEIRTLTAFYRNKISKDLAKTSVESGGYLYGLSDEYEFAAEFISNPKFREWIGKNEGTEKTNVIKEIWRKVLNLLGINKQEIDEELLDRIQKSLETVMEANTSRKKPSIDEQNKKDTPTKTEGEETQQTRIDSQGESSGTDADVRPNISEEGSGEIRPTLASRSDFYSVSEKKLALDDIKSKVKELVKQGKLTQAQAKSLINRALGVDPTNENQVNKFLEYFEKQMNLANKRDTKNTVRLNKRKVKKSARSKGKSTPQNLKDLARGAGKINEKYLSESDLKKFNKLLEEINDAFKSATNKNYEMVKYQEVREKLEALNEKAENGRAKELASKMGVDSENLSLKELEELWKSENADEFAENLKEAKAKEARRLLEKQAEFSKIALNDYSNTDLTKEEQSALKGLKKANLSSMSTNMLRQFIKISDNIVVNDDFSNAGILQAKSKADSDLTKVINFFRKSKVNPRELNTSTETARILGINVPSTFSMDFIKHLINSMTSLNITMDVIGGSSKIGSMLYNRLGFFELSNSKVRAEIKSNKFEKGYNDLIKKIAKKNPRVLDGEQVVRRSVMSTLLQSDQGSSESMQYFKDTYIKGSIKTLQGYKRNHQQSEQKVEIMENILTELEGISTKEDLVNYLKTNDSDNYKLLKFASDGFLSHTKEFESNSYLNHGESFEARTKEDFYLPLTRVSITPKSMREKVDDARSSMNFMSYSSTDSKSGSIFSRKKNARLDKGQTINFNFDSSIMSKYGEQVYDIEAAQSILTIKNILSSQDFIDTFGLGTAKVLQQKAIDKIMVDSGAVMTSSQQHEKILSKFEQVIRKVGSMIALGGVDQYAKQYPAVVMSASIRLGKDAPLLGKYMFTRKGNIELLKRSSIVLRGETNAGTKRVSDDIRYEDLSLGGRTKINAVARTLSKTTGQSLEKAREMVMLSLRAGDVNAANTTFLSYYHAYLRGKGVKDSDIDMDTEHIKIDEGDKVRKAAQAYAQHMVNTTQTSSDLSEGSSLISNPSIATRFLAGVVIPFSSHANNAMIRIMKAGRNITLGKNKAENSAEVIASLSEIMIFHSMKAFILAPATIYLAQMMYGLGDDDDEQLIDWAFQRNKAFSGIAGDISPLPDSFDIDAMNYLGYLENRSKFADDEDYSFKDYMREVKEIQRGKSKYYDPEEAPFTFYRYGDADGWDIASNPAIDIGLYNIPIEQASKTWEALDFVLDGKMDKTSKYGKKEEYILDEEHKTFMMFYTLKQLLSTFGAYDATDRRMMEKKYREIVRNSKE